MSATKLLIISDKARGMIDALGNYIFYTHSPAQILIDFVDDDLGDILDDENPPNKDAVGSLQYRLDLIREIYNKELTQDIEVINKIDDCLKEVMKSPTIYPPKLKQQD